MEHFVSQGFPRTFRIELDIPKFETIPDMFEFEVARNDPTFDNFNVARIIYLTF